jgi:hypothetical protein
MTPAWAPRQAELWSDCLVSPDVFNPMRDRRRPCVANLAKTSFTPVGSSADCMRQAPPERNSILPSLDLMVFGSYSQLAVSCAALF